MSRFRPNTTGILNATLLVFVLLSTSYMGTYYANLKGRVYGGCAYGPSWAAWPVYRIGGPDAATVFSRANRIDRAIRPNYWRPVGDEP